jgi:hypothetical protein
VVRSGLSPIKRYAWKSARAWRHKGREAMMAAAVMTAGLKEAPQMKDLRRLSPRKPVIPATLARPQARTPVFSIRISVTGRAEFPLQLILIYGADCSDLEYTVATSGPCVPSSLSHDATTGQETWIWVGAQSFSGIAESNYLLEVCGILEAPPGLGACCDGTGCWVCPEVSCTGTWLGPGTVCDPNPCDDPTPALESSWGRIKAGYR